MKIETKFDKRDKVYFRYDASAGYVNYAQGEVHGIKFPTKFNFNYIDLKIKYVIYYNPTEHNFSTGYNAIELPEEDVFETEKEAAAICLEKNRKILQELEQKKTVIQDKISELENLTKQA